MKRTIVFKKVIILLLLTNISYAQNKKLYPLPFIKVDGKIILTGIKLEGDTRNRTFLLDTASDSYLFTDSLSTSSGEKQHVSGNNTEKEYQKVSKTIHLGGQSFEEVVFLEDTAKWLPEEMKCYNIDGILGFNFMKKFDWLLTDEKILFGKLDKETSEGFHSVPLKLLDKKYPMIVAGIKNDYFQTMIFDLGDNALMAIRKDDLKFIDIDSTLKGTGIAYLTGLEETNTNNNYAVHFPKNNFVVGSSEIEGIVIDEIDGISAIGSEFLDYFDVILSFRSKKFFFKRKNKSLTKKKRLDFSVAYDPYGKPYIAFVFETKEMIDKKIKSGTFIHQINGLNITESKMEKCALIQAVEKELSRDQLDLVLVDEDNNTTKFSFVRDTIFQHQ